MKFIRWILVTALLIFCIAIVMLGALQRRLLYFPTHENGAESAAQLGLSRWEIDGEYTGYARLVPEPRKVWFFTHGNGGQAANRAYLLERISPQDAVYILEYPGYGERVGKPSKSSFDQAALKAYTWVVRHYGVEKIVVLGESLGSGPASLLAQAPDCPKHIVLVVPFAVLTDVAQESFPFLPVRLLMLDQWNNIEALKNYTGRLDIFGAKDDNVIPVHHARRLATAHPTAIYHEIEGGHGWAHGNRVDLSSL